MTLTIDQLRAFIQSSTKLGHPDRQVAEYLKHVHLSQRLDARTIEDMQGLGAGPKTAEALRALGEQSKALPAPPAPVAKPVYTPPPPPSSIEQANILKEASEYARDYSKRLPNFICVQVTRRYADPTGLEFWHLMDTVTARLSYFEQKEDYKVVLVNDRAVDTNFNSLGGATSSGEFGSMMREIFAPESDTRFEWDHWATLRAKRMHVYRYNVDQAHSRWSVVYEKTDRVVPAYHGFIYVDADTHAIMRITLEADDLPLGFPVRQARTRLDYDFQKIADQEFILPLKAEVYMRGNKLMYKNETEFRLYRKFGAEATITLTPDRLPDSATEEGKPQQ